MTDKQLAILLRKYALLVRNQIAAIEEKLPSEMLKEQTNLLGQESAYYPVMRGLYELADVIEFDADILDERRAT